MSRLNCFVKIVMPNLLRWDHPVTIFSSTISLLRLFSWDCPLEIFHSNSSLWMKSAKIVLSRSFYTGLQILSFWDCPGMIILGILSWGDYPSPLKRLHWKPLSYCGCLSECILTSMGFLRITCLSFWSNWIFLEGSYNLCQFKTYYQSLFLYIELCLP